MTGMVLHVLSNTWRFGSRSQDFNIVAITVELSIFETLIHPLSHRKNYSNVLSGTGRSSLYCSMLTFISACLPFMADEKTNTLDVCVAIFIKSVIYTTFEMIQYQTNSILQVVLKRCTDFDVGKVGLTRICCGVLAGYQLSSVSLSPHILNYNTFKMNCFCILSFIEQIFSNNFHR